MDPKFELKEIAILRGEECQNYPEKDKFLVYYILNGKKGVFQSKWSINALEFIQEHTLNYQRRQDAKKKEITHFTPVPIPGDPLSFYMIPVCRDTKNLSDS